MKSQQSLILESGMSKNQQIAAKILNMAKSLGWSINIRNTVLEITKPISTMEEFVTADGEYYSILGLVPTTSAGSTWGTDGGGVGAVSAMNRGIFSMKKSGCSVRVLNALEKMM